MAVATRISRRNFIQFTAASGALLAIGCVPTSGKDARIVNLLLEPGNDAVMLNAYIFIESSGKITLYNHRPEMGQGTFQSIPMIIAEELEVDVEKITIEQSPANRALYGDQMVVGSRSIQNNYELMRKVGATAKDMLIRAAAETWKVDVNECYAKDATIMHRPSNRKLLFGELAEKASKLQPAENPKLKDPSTFTTIGKSLPRQDVPLKVNGDAKFGMDVTLPGMLYACLMHSPVILGKVVSIDDSKTKAIAGVKDVLKTKFDFRGTTREAVAVLADTYWAAEQGCKVLNVTWDNGSLESVNTQSIFNDYHKAAKEQDAVVLQQNGEFNSAFINAKIKIEAAYETPYQAHACMEPMNATVYVQPDKVEYWGSTQNPNGVKSFLARFCGVSEEKVVIHYAFMGGGFGRRSLTDLPEEAADLSKKTGAPVKVIWSREDDIIQGPFRACSLNVCRGAIDEKGNPIALEHKVVCQEINNQTGDNMKAGQQIAGGINTEYSIPNVTISGVLRKNHIPVSYWRAVYHSTNCFAHESFIDELAHAAKRDPLEFRLALIKDHKRYTQVLNTVAKQSGWYDRKKNTGKGVAIVERSGAFVAIVAEVTRVKGKIAIVKITAAIDCGIPVHPDNIKAQTEGSIVMGLTATYKSAITIDKGQATEKNFDRYRMLELNECPPIEVTVIESKEKPEGAGEGGLPPVAPAITNAIFDLTKKRIRALPFKLEDV